MTNLLIRFFVPNAEQVRTPSVRQRYGYLAGMVGIFSNVILFFGKLGVGFLFSSISIVADAVNNLSDAGSSIITLISFKISAKPADNKHPFGHERVEYISSLLISVVIMLLGLELVRSSFAKILMPRPTEFSFLTMGVLLASIAVKLWQGQFNKRVGKMIDSSSLIATGVDSMNDVYATSGVLLSQLISAFSGWELDGYIGVAVAVFIILSGVSISKDALNLLLGEAPDDDLVKTIEDKITSYEGILGIHDLVIHNYGPNKRFASVHAEVSATQDILVSHDIIDNIERDFMDDMKIHLVIHLDPLVTDNAQINELHQLASTVVRSISPTFSLHDFRAVLGTSHSNLIFDVTVPCNFPLGNQEIVEEIQRQISSVDATLFVVVTIDSAYSTFHL